MKKFLVIGSLAAVMLMTGCSQKGSAVSDSADSKVSGMTSGKDNFSDMDAKSALIRELESQLKSVYFDFDKFNIRADMQPVVDGDAKVLTSAKAKGLTVKIEGNTDEWGTDEYNYALGLKRAVAVRDALVAKGVDQSKTMLISYGESKPVCQEKNKECWAKNRRVDFKLLP
ncbi:OmpA family protein [Wolinella succinogenes]|uniref:OmpA family protein n=1 Tax=Wolinella succinogenes TaxID=844 RepID=UPI0024090E13|nr:OmpA family protein [Wolinella succinogenes]